jgi:hypothetical protein
VTNAWKVGGPTLVAVWVALGCQTGPSAYLHAVTSFAGTTADGVTSLGALPATAASICRKRAVARFLKSHLLPGTQTPPKWEDYYTAAGQADGTLSWQQYCADIQATSANFASLLTMLSDYANALKTLAATGSWDGAPLSTALTKSASLAGSKTPAGTALTALAPAAQQIGSVAVAKYTADRAHDFAAAANTPFQSILDGLNNYVIAVNRDVVGPSKKERVEVVNDLEARASVWSDTPDAGRIIAFATYAQSVDDDLAAIDAQIAAYTALIGKLKAGHGSLVAKPQDDSSSKDITSAASDILGALTQLGTTVSGK